MKCICSSDFVTKITQYFGTRDFKSYGSLYLGGAGSNYNIHCRSIMECLLESLMYGIQCISNQNSRTFKSQSNISQFIFQQFSFICLKGDSINVKTNNMSFTRNNILDSQSHILKILQSGSQSK